MVNKVVQNYFDSLTDVQKLDKENLFVYSTYTASIEELLAKSSATIINIKNREFNNFH